MERRRPLNTNWAEVYSAKRNGRPEISAQRIVRKSPIESLWRDVSKVAQNEILDTMHRNMAPKDPMTRELGTTQPHEVNLSATEQRIS